MRKKIKSLNRRWGKTGISRQGISHWENDRNLPDIEMLILISRSFNISLNELILGGNEMNNIPGKIIRDSSDTKRIKIKMVRIGIALFVLSLISYFYALLFAPISMENYFSDFSSYLMLSGFILVFVVGVLSFSEKFQEKGDKNYEVLTFIGLGAMILGVMLYAITLMTGWFSGIFGIILCFIGFITIIFIFLI
ncbi:helix-turn-helix domain-containing protein [Staphylococcus simulans]|uniref:helix-turn-helix transcriptional regulator n=1 Tax=Staphylococcus simulans TaxID=1286 RepID=UPI001A8D302E|nr:helix-turn-helix transcriptional regulator [Staphylococcus simulans]MBO0385966.1 helix-turn-helix domain-containing protein [Staphylococcus simulans]